MNRALPALMPTMPAPSQPATDLTLLLLAANEIAAIGSGYRANARGIADAWKNAKAWHFAALAKKAGVTVRMGTFPAFCAELERRASS